MSVLRRRARKDASAPLFTSEDGLFLLKLPVVAAAALLAPERSWGAISRWLESVTRWFSRGRIARIRQGMSVDAALSAPDPLGVLANQSEMNIGVLRDCLVGWSPRITLTGAAHLDAARDAGRGGVLWVAHFCFNSLVGKMALAQAGYRCHHISRPEHGFSKSRFGMRVLNPMRIAAERRHLAGRVLIDRNKPSAAIAEAMQLLKANTFVSITAGAWEGQLIARAPLGKGEIDLATGAPRLASAAGAPLIPVFVLQDEASGRFSVIVDAPIALAPGGDRGSLVARATDAFMQRHLPHVAAHPCQWREWEKFRAA